MRSQPTTEGTTLGTLAAKWATARGVAVTANIATAIVFSARTSDDTPAGERSPAGVLGITARRALGAADVALDVALFDRAGGLLGRADAG